MSQLEKNDIDKLIRKRFDNVSITDEVKFKAFWNTLKKEDKQNFIKEMSEFCMKNLGLPANEISEYLGKKFRQLGFLKEKTIRKYISIEFKNIRQSMNRRGKTFESMGRETGEIKRIQEIVGKKYENMEEKILVLKKKNIELEIKILKKEIKENNEKPSDQQNL